MRWEFSGTSLIEGLREDGHRGEDGGGVGTKDVMVMQDAACTDG